MRRLEDDVGGQDIRLGGEARYVMVSNFDLDAHHNIINRSRSAVDLRENRTARGTVELEVDGEFLLTTRVDLAKLQLVVAACGALDCRKYVHLSILVRLVVGGDVHTQLSPSHPESL